MDFLQIDAYESHSDSSGSLASSLSDDGLSDDTLFKSVRESGTVNINVNLAYGRNGEILLEPINESRETIDSDCQDEDGHDNMNFYEYSDNKAYDSSFEQPAANQSVQNKLLLNKSLSDNMGQRRDSPKYNLEPSSEYFQR